MVREWIGCFITTLVLRAKVSVKTNKAARWRSQSQDIAHILTNGTGMDSTGGSTLRPCYDVLVGPRKQRREQVSCRLLSPAFTGQKGLSACMIEMLIRKIQKLDPMEKVKGRHTHADSLWQSFQGIFRNQQASGAQRKDPIKDIQSRSERQLVAKYHKTCNVSFQRAVLNQTASRSSMKRQDSAGCFRWQKLSNCDSLKPCAAPAPPHWIDAAATLMQAVVSFKQAQGFSTSIKFCQVMSLCTCIGCFRWRFWQMLWAHISEACWQGDGKKRST